MSFATGTMAAVFRTATTDDAATLLDLCQVAAANLFESKPGSLSHSLRTIRHSVQPFDFFPSAIDRTSKSRLVAVSNIKTRMNVATNLAGEEVSGHRVSIDPHASFTTADKNLPIPAISQRIIAGDQDAGTAANRTDFFHDFLFPAMDMGRARQLLPKCADDLGHASANHHKGKKSSDKMYRIFEKKVNELHGASQDCFLSRASGWPLLTEGARFCRSTERVYLSYFAAQAHLEHT